jgi:hypothetical protein
MEFEVVKPEVLAGLRARDDAASFKCKGGACLTPSNATQKPGSRGKNCCVMTLSSKFLR